jgi:hypothetical protein
MRNYRFVCAAAFAASASAGVLLLHYNKLSKRERISIKPPHAQNLLACCSAQVRPFERVVGT